jgi:hypothetical protein
MSTGDFHESFSDIANWVNDFAGGIGAAHWGSVAINASGTIPDGVKVTTATSSFASGTSGGVQKGTGTIVLLTTGAGDGTNACAIDLHLDFSSRNAGTLSFDWAEVNNSTGDRASSLRVYATPDGSAFTELASAFVSVSNNVPASGTRSLIALPASLDGSPTARIRFYEYNATGGTTPTGSRAKISIDNVAVTATGGTETQPSINSIVPANITTNVGSTVSFTVSASGGGLGYSWYKQAGPTSNLISGATTATLTLPNVGAADATNYFAVVSNSVGVGSSSPVSLAVTVPLPQLPVWYFNNTSGSDTSPVPSAGSGIAGLLGGVSPSFVSGAGSSDPTSGDNSAWSTTGYPASSAANKSAGVEFRVNTSGFQDIVVQWDDRHSGTASRYKRFQYSLDGVNFVDHLVLANTNISFVSHTNDLTGITGVNNNPNFAFRIVTEFEDTATGSGTNFFVATSTTYGTSGTIRYDMMTVIGTPSGGAPGIPLAIQLSGNSAQLTWNNGGYTLLAAPVVTGPYTNVPGATSPYSTPASGPRMFFRLTNSAAGP